MAVPLASRQAEGRQGRMSIDLARFQLPASALAHLKQLSSEFTATIFRHSLLSGFNMDRMIECHVSLNVKLLFFDDLSVQSCY